MRFINYNPKEIEPQIQEYWNQKKVVEKLRKRNNQGKKFYFLQGPPYTSGKVHLGTAWNTVLKDIALRYKRDRGFKVWDRNGYDVHGLPTEHKVMAKYNLQTKEDIQKFGISKFVKECQVFSSEMGEQMTKDFLRMGSTLDYSDSYLASTKEYMEGEWWLIKQAWKNKRLYLGDKSMTWCGNCETALAKHECEYQNIKEESVFLKFPVKGKKKEFLIVWTTTPWTIAFNLAVMVNPELDYVRAKVEDETWIVGKGLVGPLVHSVAGKSFTLLEEFKGKKLLGTEYTHPWEKEIALFQKLKEEHKKVHTIILSKEYVDFSAGSGLVHCAPGCGPEDQEIGKVYGLPAFNNLTEKGEFPLEMGTQFAGRIAKKDDHLFIADLDKAKALIATSKVEHEYPTCWRCHKPVIFKTTKQWFFKIEDLKQRMIEENEKVNWIPQSQTFDAWTSNLRDNSITRQRFWGTPVPIWKCSHCEQIEVIGSIKELKEKANKIPADIHRPWIDKVSWNCKCKKGKMERIPDILDVWIDAGTASWNCLYYPAKTKYFKEYFPADLILEATEQVRLWFSMLSICSQLALGKNSYQNVYMHGMLRDVEGVKMSKSLGNIITPDEMIEKHGADVLRYYMCQTNAGQDIRFSWEEAALKSRFLQILWNVHKLLINLSKENKINPEKLNKSKSIINNVLELEEKYILSKLNSTIKKVTELFDAYRFDETIGPLEELYLELSRTYIQMVRDKSSLGEEQDKEVVIYTINQVLLELLKMFNIIAPFISEAIYLNLKEEFGLKEESISHYPWPKYDESRIDLQLEQEFEIIKLIVQAALNAREQAKLGLRWPVKELVITTKNKEAIEAAEKLKDIIRKQTNVKEIVLIENLPGVKLKIRPDAGRIGQVYKELLPQIIARLTVDSPQTIFGHLEKESVYQFKLESGQKVKINRGMLNITREVPSLYKESEFKLGQVYINTERSKELEAEGYAREIMRNIQQLRKQAGLEKLDRINLFLKVREELKKDLEQFKLEIEEKVGAEKMEIAYVDSVKKHQHSAEFKVKNEKCSVWFSKV